MKNNKSNPAHEYEVLIPLVNLLLFEKFDAPDFEYKYEKLSNDFIEATKTINQDTIEENNFFTKRVFYFLTELSAEQREQVYYIIVDNDLYIGAMSMSYIIEHNLSMDEESSFLSQAEILKNAFEFKDDAKMSKTIFYYFIFQFEHIMYLKFSDSKIITELEYNNIIDKLGSIKEPTFK